MSKRWDTFACAALLWLLVTSSFITIASAHVFRVAARNDFHQTVLDGSAPAPGNSIQSLLLFDNRTITQRFIVDSTTVTSLHLGAKNLNNTSPEATVTLSLEGEDGTKLIEQHLTTKDFWQDDLTKISNDPVQLNEGLYKLVLTSQGIPKGEDLAIFFQPQIFKPSVRQLSIKENGIEKSLSGHIGFKLEYKPTYTDIVKSQVQTSTGKIAIALGCAWLLGSVIVIINLSTAERKKSKIKRAAKAIPLTYRRLTPKDLLLPLAVASIAAFFITAPFYANLSSSTVFGDIRRALVYRGVARTSLVNYHQMGLWEPYQCGGAPLLANSESAQLDPTFLLTLAFGENLGLRLSVTTMLIVSFLGAYLIAFQFMGGGRTASLIAGALFTFSGFQMLGFSVGAYAWLPVGWLAFCILFYLHSLHKLAAMIPAAIILSFTFLGGGIHMFVWGVIALTTLAITQSVIYKSSRPLVSLALIIAITISVTAIKLVPAAELQAVSSFSRPSAFIPPITWAPKIFLDRGQLSTPPWFYEPADQFFRWYDFGSYIGLVPFTLIIGAILLAGKNKMHISTLIAAGILLLMAFGLPPWTWITKQNEVAEILRNPQRVRVLAILLFGAAAAATANKIQLALPKKIGLGFVVSLSLFILLDLISLHHPLFFETFALPQANIPATETFIRKDSSYRNPATGHFKASYDTYKAGYGTTDSCLPFMFDYRANVSGYDTTDANRPYFGEAYTPDGKQAELTLNNPNEFTVTLNNPNAEWLTINTNYFPGWETQDGRPVTIRDGKIATRLQEGDSVIQFKYSPASYVVGKYITLSAIGLMLLYLLIPYAHYPVSHHRDRSVR